MFRKCTQAAKVLLFSILWCIFAYNPAFGYESIVFNNITIENGLPQSTVEYITQDSNGYIWIGTNDGLVRFNGYDYIIYRKDHKDSSSIIGNYILKVYEDIDKNIWVGTTDGISKLSNKESNVKNYSLNDGLTDLCVFDILELKDGSIVAATSCNGLFKLNKKTDKFEPLKINGLDNSKKVYSITQDKNGDLLVAGENFLNHIKINDDSEVVTKFTDKYDELKDIEIYRLYIDKNDELWIGTTDSGVFNIDKEGNIINYRNNDDKNSLVGNFVRDITMDSLGNVWVCTNEGLSKINSNSGKVISFRSNNYDIHSLIDNNIRCVFEDDTGLLWIGTYKGISIFDSKSNIQHFKVENDKYNSGLSENMITAIYEDKQGYIWVGTGESGINIIDLEGDNIEKLSIGCNKILDIVEHKDIMYVGTKDGLFLLDRKSKSIIKRLDNNNGLNSNYIRRLYVDSNDRLWIGTDKGIDLYFIQSKNIKNINEVHSDYKFDDFRVGDIFEDSKGNIWVGNFGSKGIVRFSNNLKKCNNFCVEQNTGLSNNTIRTILEDNKGDIWIGTSGGINKYSYENNNFKSYTSYDGLTNDTIYGIVEDNDFLWMSTNAGIEKFDINNEISVNFNVLDGLQSNEFNGNAYYKLKNGLLAFGGVNGLNIINPLDMNMDNNEFNVNIDKVKINGVEVKDTENLELKYFENSLTIKLFTSQYRNIKRIKYYYRFDDKDEVWSEMEGNEIILSNLRPGKYNFEVKAVRGINESNNTANLSFVIRQPIWKSAYAIIAYLIIIILVICRARNTVKTLDKEVGKRTVELKHQLNKNEELYNKIINLEKRKNNYLVNLSHELRTPINVISSTQQLINKFNNEDITISKEKMSYYMSIQDKNIRRLLNLINNLIDTEKIEHGNYKINIREYNIVSVVEEATLSLKQYAESKKISLIVDPEIEECIVECDNYEIERCIVNLVSNAIRFTDAGGEIVVAIKEKNDHITIIVEDDGCGIEENLIGTIFDRFSQGTESSKESKGGSGLGLAITKSIVELHGGNISVKSVVNTGTKFIINLPKIQKRDNFKVER